MQSNHKLMTSKSQIRESTFSANRLTELHQKLDLSPNGGAKKVRLPCNQTAKISTFMDDMPRTIQRKHQRVPVKIPILANGVDKNGQLFTEPTQTVNGSLGGMALLLDHEPSPSSYLRISILHRQHQLHLQTEVCHVTACRDKKIVGVKFRGIQNDFSA